jgi:hypothetical protein
MNPFIINKYIFKLLFYFNAWQLRKRRRQMFLSTLRGPINPIGGTVTYTNRDVHFAWQYINKCARGASNCTVNM